VTYADLIRANVGIDATGNIGARWWFLWITIQGKGLKELVQLLQ
jgi:hypothetical protein